MGCAVRSDVGSEAMKDRSGEVNCNVGQTLRALNTISLA